MRRLETLNKKRKLSFESSLSRIETLVSRHRCRLRAGCQSAYADVPDAEIFIRSDL